MSDSLDPGADAGMTGAGEPLREQVERGMARLRERAYADARAELSKALAAAMEGGDTGMEAEARHGLLRAAYLTDDRRGALDHGIHALEAARQSGDLHRIAGAHNDLGLVYGVLTDFERSLEHLRAGLEVTGDHGDLATANLRNNIGNVYLELQEPEEALSFFRAALHMYRHHDSRRGEAIALGNIGRALAATGEHAEALAAFQASVAAFEDSGETLYRAAALSRLATARAAVGDEAGAGDTFREAIERIEERDSPEFADEVFLAAGRFHLERGDAGTAASLLSRGLSALPAGEASQRVYDLHLALSEAYEAAGNAERALAHFERYHDIRRRVTDVATTIRIHGMMLELDVAGARQKEEAQRLRTEELSRANEELQELQMELQLRNRELQRISQEDALTGLHNRRYLDAHLAHEVARSQRYGRPLSVAICDIDRFKEINDALSHGVSDEVLRVMGDLLRSSCREEDAVARYGGEEFVMMLPETGIEGARTLAERLRARVEAHSWEGIHPNLRVTVSIGLAELAEEQDAPALVAAAAERLFEAKRAGRNRVEG
jgi:diguanylate cyclase (GGDEF)-like protein